MQIFFKKNTIALLTTISLLGTQLLPAAPRQWTDNRERTTTAELVSHDGTTARLRSANGKIYTFPIARLCTADREYILATPPESEEKSPAPKNTPTPLAERTWPDKVYVGYDIPVDIQVPTGTEKLYTYTSPHFVFRSDARLAQKIVSVFARIFEVTHEAVRLLPLNLEPQAPPQTTHFQCRLYRNKEDYLKAGGMPGSGGVYMGRTATIHIPLDSLGVEPFGSGFRLTARDENSTVIHEVVHQMMHKWLRAAPNWITEGAAEFVASGDYARGRITFTNHHRSIADILPRHYATTAHEITMNHPYDMITRGDDIWGSLTDDTGRTSYLSSLLLFYYFANFEADSDGVTPMINFFDAIGKKADYRTTANQFFIKGRSPEKLATDISKSLARKGLDITFEPLREDKKASSTP